MCYRAEGLCTCARSERFEPFTSDSQGQRLDQQERDCKFTCVANAHSVRGLPQKKGVNPNYCQNYTEIKSVKMCRSLELCKSCHKCHNCCHRSTCRGKAAPVWGKMGNPGGESKGSNSTGRRLHPFLPVQTQPNQITNCRKQLYQPSQKSQLFGGTVSAGEQKCSRTIENQNSLGFYNRLFLVTKPNNRRRPILDLSTLNTFLNTESFNMETPETIRTSLQAGSG